MLFLNMPFLYAVPVWDLHLCKNIDALEAVQKFATKICTKSWNTRHYQDRLGTLPLDNLRKRRPYPKQCHLFKLVNGLSPFPIFPLTVFHCSNFCSYTFQLLSFATGSFSHTNAFYSLLFVMLHLSGTPYLILLFQHLVSNLL